MSEWLKKSFEEISRDVTNMPTWARELASTLQMMPQHEMSSQSQPLTPNVQAEVIPRTK
jgi:hypothetical protein